MPPFKGTKPLQLRGNLEQTANPAGRFRPAGSALAMHGQNDRPSGNGCYKARAHRAASPPRPMTLVDIPANPVPDNVVAGEIKTPDGVALRFARWAPPPGRKGTVCIFPGRAEFIEKYFETVRDLRARGFAVAALDSRGQGLAQRALGNRRKGYVRRFSDYRVDLHTFINQVVLPDCPSPVFALAHSMGASVLLMSAYQG